jgi:hypothetical protein
VSSGKSQGPDSDDFIAERFPPLQERIKGWDIAELITRIQSEKRDDQPGYSRRERILIHELISRTPTPEQLDELELTRTYHAQTYLNEEGNPSKAGVLRDREYPSELIWDVMQEMCTQGKLPFYEKKIRSLFSSSQRGSSLGLGTILGATQYCFDVNFSDLALRAIREGADVYGSLGYLRRHGNTHKLAVELETLAVPDQYKNDHELAVQEIHGRADEKRHAK